MGEIWNSHQSYHCHVRPRGFFRACQSTWGCFMFQQRRVAIDLIQWKYQGYHLSALGRCFGCIWNLFQLQDVEFSVSKVCKVVGFKHCVFSPRNLGKMNPFWRSYFWDGLVQPPTSLQLGMPEMVLGLGKQQWHLRLETREPGMQPVTLEAGARNISRSVRPWELSGMSTSSRPFLSRRLKTLWALQMNLPRSWG